MHSVDRIIDADENRAREALRVIEDAARFVLDDRELCALCKKMRHDLAEAVDALPGGRMRALAHRDTPNDVGTDVTTEGEQTRATLRAVVVAAGKRLEESLRSLEECVKTLDPKVALRIESLRYRSYDLERRMTLAMGAAREGFTGWRLSVILSTALCTHHPWQDVARLAIQGGADCVQIREKNVNDREMLARIRALVDIAASEAQVVVNDRPDLALLAGAHAAHLGQQDITVPEARRLAGSDLILGVSTATLDDARAALRDGADVCGVGPMFFSTTKQMPRLSGPEYLNAYLEHKPALPPCLAIGGVTPESLPSLVQAAGGKPFGVAVSAYICSSPDPAQAAARLLDMLPAES